MSSCVMTVMAAGDCPTVLSLLETEVTSIFISSSRFIFLNLFGPGPVAATDWTCSEEGSVVGLRRSPRPSTVANAPTAAQMPPNISPGLRLRAKQERDCLPEDFPLHNGCLNETRSISSSLSSQQGLHV